MRYIHRIIGPLTVMIAMVLGLLATPAQAAATHVPQKSTTTVHMLSDGSVVPGAWSKLITRDSGAFGIVHTKQLTPGDATTLWWVVFNHPEHCTHGQMGLACGEGDVALFGGDPAVGSSVLFADGRVINASGRGTYVASLPVGDTTGALFGPGLTNPLGAEIHFVVRSHGPAIPGLVAEQTSTFGGGCNDAPPGTGTPGPNTCTDLQFAAHAQ